MRAVTKSVRVRLRFACGHAGEMNLSGTEAVCRLKAAVSATQPCNECLAGELTEYGGTVLLAELAADREEHDKWRAAHPDRSESWDLTT